ncbi:class I SAM-dependent methyltransferase [Candidatus Saccharibacteria bacterium]|nr:MAG: class I SAM-dependent methyltransferase [Candidatus Saccharibacteria bacterium]
MHIHQNLITKYPLISEQVSKLQVEVILRELTRVLDAGVEGDIVEFGCYIGTTSLFIRRLLDNQQTASVKGRSFHAPEFHVYDSFEGLPEKSVWDASPSGEQFTAGELAVSKKQFLREFQKAHLQPPIVHKGWFSSLTEKDVPENISFAFLDGDFYESIHDSLRLVLPRMQKGGVIVVDDYAREALPGAAKAVHEYFQSEHVKAVHNLGVIYL